jgi:hypothetical protein
MSAHQTTKTAALEVAERDGYNAGYQGQAKANPHPDSELRIVWDTHYDYGAAHRKSEDDPRAGPGPWGWHGMGYMD